MKDFVHLHVHTQFSLLDSTIRADRLFALTKKFGMNACAITDYGNMFGVVDFYFEAKKVGIKPIIGCEAYLAPKFRFDKKKVGGKDNAYHIVLLAMNDKGYRNLMKLITLGYTEGFYYVPRIDKEILRQYNEGLICLTACLKGEIPQAVLSHGQDMVKALVEEYLSIFGDRLYFELQDNGIVEQKIINKALVDLSLHYNIPIVATNDCHYLRKKDARAHKLLNCIQGGKTIDDMRDLISSSNDFYFKSSETMALSFSRYPEALSNSIKIAERCDLSIDSSTHHFPEFKAPMSMSPDDYLEQLADAGFDRRLRDLDGDLNETLLEKYRQRFNYEMGVIKNMGYSSYFLVIADCIRYAKKHDIPAGPGRGGVAGSLVSFCLGITEVDPIKHDLIFERFLNPERANMPDIDIDFCMDKRDKVVRYVTKKYGRDNVARISSFRTMNPKTTMLDVGRALGIPQEETDKIVKSMKDRGIKEAIKHDPQIIELYSTNKRAKKLLDNATVLEGLVHHVSTHVAGIVVADKTLTEYTPLWKRENGEIVTQYDMKAIEKTGLIKIDLLGFEALTLIDAVVKSLKGRGIDLNIAGIPLDDRKTFQLLSSGDTAGVFMFENRGMKELVTILEPSRFDDIVALVALFRPITLRRGIVNAFFKQRENPCGTIYEIPLLDEILKDSYGVIIYQEQIIKIASVLGGLSLAKADTLRRAMLMKMPEELIKYRAQFIEGTKNNGVPGKVAKQIYKIMIQASEYAFNKSHATSYGLVAYQTAYLKANYPIHFSTVLSCRE